MILAGLAFLISGFVELKLEAGYPIIPGPSQTQIRIFNGLNCPYNFQTNLPEDNAFELGPMDVFERKIIQLDGTNGKFNLKATGVGACGDFEGNFELKDAKATSYFLTNKLGKPEMIAYEESPDKPKKGFPVIRILLTSNDTREVSLKHLNKDIVRSFFSNSTEMKSLLVGDYAVFVDNIPVSSLTIRPGAAYTMVLREQKDGSYVRFETICKNLVFNCCLSQMFKSHVIVPPNDIHILWQIPQYIIVTAGEVSLKFFISMGPN